MLPTRQHGAPGKPAAHGLHHDQPALFQTLCLEGVIEGQGYGCRGRITVLRQCLDNLLGIDTQLLGDAVEDAAIGLVRHEKVDLVGREPLYDERFLDHA